MDCSCAVLAVAVALIAGGCAAPPLSPSPLEAPPGFSLEITLLDRSADPPDPGTITRCILLADGALYFGRRQPGPLGREWWYGWQRWPDWFPPRVRWLTRPEVQECWDLCRAAGLTDGESGGPAGGAIEPDRGSTVTIATVTIETIGASDRWYRTVEANPAQANPAQANPAQANPAQANPAQPEQARTNRCAALLERLAALAWAAPDAPALPTPQRTDFGPDPYANLRRGGL